MASSLGDHSRYVQEPMCATPDSSVFDAFEDATLERILPKEHSMMDISSKDRHWHIAGEQSRACGACETVRVWGCRVRPLNTRITS